ncbi:hypothetical protein G4V62_16315 [Bacillaceae bacterium SIJ1]|uniref:glycosyl hydrolase family 8 n=1 Tax=Litoribacterium kuwaitense TaxID=1398745 RepID=UPI0013EB1C72|nr:glycosyl hydrolase family 8 [Litoribacterium kuwaitense]NGP46435.1 hypothetical protein [Litoribacterium kuwaitense]
MGGLLTLLLILLTFLFTEDTSTETFVNDHFIKDNGEITTYMTSDDILSESIGLYMEYLVETEQKQAFDEQAALVRTKMDDGFIYWRFNAEANANASVDDLRIMRAFYGAHALWQEETYQTLGNEIKQFILSEQVKNNLIVDYYDMKSLMTANEVHLSYIDGRALRNFFPNNIQQAHTDILKRVSDDPFFLRYISLSKRNIRIRKKLI